MLYVLTLKGEIRKRAVANVTVHSGGSRHNFISDPATPQAAVAFSPSRKLHDRMLQFATSDIQKLTKFRTQSQSSRRQSLYSTYW